MKQIADSDSKSALSTLINNEIAITKGAGKYLWIAVFFNIPVWGFIPYVSQAITIIILFVFLKHFITEESLKQEKIDNHEVQYTIKSWAKPLIYATMVLQLIWIPYVLQFLTLISLGIIYANFTKYTNQSIS